MRGLGVSGWVEGGGGRRGWGLRAGEGGVVGRGG